MNQTDIYKMIAVPTTDLMESEINSLLAQKDVLQSLYRYASDNTVRTRILELQRTQDNLEANSLELLNLWKTQVSVEEMPDPTLIEKATLLLIQIRNHKSNINDVKKQMEGMESSSLNIIDSVTSYGPAHGINQYIWYGILVISGYFLIKKVLK